MKTLLTITAAVEVGAGIAFAVVPSTVASALLGSPLDSPSGVVLGRVLGAALFALGMACWLTRQDARGRAASGLISAMLVYNLAVVALLAHARISLGRFGIGALPAALLHSGMAAWCYASGRHRRECSLRIDAPAATTRPESR
jgi:hypothetical protein